MRRSSSRFVGAVVLIAVTLTGPPASAYRPFDSTDAAVAELGSFELELGPAQWLRSGRQIWLVEPATVLNLGIFKDTELVFDLENFVAHGPLDGRPRDALLNTDVLVKHVFREGALQGKSGLSFAIEAGPLTPEYNGSRSFGASLDALFSYRWSWATVHFNERPSLTRDGRLDLFTGVILEGPWGWVVRPVSELFFEKTLGGSARESVLVGAIWTCRESFTVDVGVRGARAGDADANEAEVRFGFTWSIPVWAPAANAAQASAPAAVTRMARLTELGVGRH